MIRKELVHNVLHDTGYAADVIEDVLTSVLDNIKVAISRGDEVNLRGFGTFKTNVRAARTARDIRKGVMIDVPEKHYIKFVPGGQMKDMVKALD